MTVFFYRELQANHWRYHNPRSAPQNTHIVQKKLGVKVISIYIITYISQLLKGIQLVGRFLGFLAFYAYAEFF